MNRCALHMVDAMSASGAARRSSGNRQQELQGGKVAYGFGLRVIAGSVLLNPDKGNALIWRARKRRAQQQVQVAPGLEKL